MAKKKWTIMVYLAGDNDLSETMAKRFIEMRHIKDKVSKINLLAYYDANNPTIKTRYENLTGHHKTGDDIAINTKLELTKLVAEENSSSPWAIKRFVKWCIEDQKAEAENYALIIAGHGDGFQRTTFLRDESSMGSLTMKGLRQSLKEIQEEIWKDADKKFQILAFDSCVMNTFEVAYELKDRVETLIGSQGYMYESGWSYQHIIEELCKLDKKDKIEKEDITEILVSSAIKPNEPYVELNARSLDVSVFNLENNKIEDAAKSIHNLGESLEAALPKEVKSENDLIYKERLKKAILSSHWRCQTYLYEQSIDIIDFCQNLMAECFQIRDGLDFLIRVSGIKLSVESNSGNGQKIEFPDNIEESDKVRIEEVIEFSKKLGNIQTACNDVLSKVGSCIDKSCYSGSEYQFSNGISLLFPWSLFTLRLSKKIYESFDFACENDGNKTSKPWYSFLTRYLEETLRKHEPEIRFAPVNIDKFNWLSADNTLIDPPNSGMIDPPNSGMLTSDYKTYFSRIKNYDWTTKSGCAK